MMHGCGRGRDRLAHETREYSTAERNADAVVHFLGIATSLVAVPLLVLFAFRHLGWGQATGLAVYGAAIVLLFVTSACYHLIPHLHWKPALKRFDQAAIFLKIAGTYTPLVLALGGVFAYVVLAGVWIAAAFGAFAKLALGRRWEKVSVAIYLPLGWASLLLVWPIFSTLPLSASLAVLAGGILYTIGVLFHIREKLAFQNAIWHGFVLAASACHFAAVSTASFALSA